MAAALILSVVIGFLFGIFNGYLVAYWKIPPFIVSMASMNIAKGIAAVFTKTQSVSWPQSSDANGWYRNFVKAGRQRLVVISSALEVIKKQSDFLA